MPTKERSSIRAQLMRLSLVIVVVSIALSLVGTLSYTLHTEQQSLDSNLINSASILAQVPLVQAALQDEIPAEKLADFLDETTERTSDIDLILVADQDNVLRYVPNREMIGDRYTGTAQLPALEGAAPYTSNEAGPMGTDHSAYAPVRDETGQIIGVMIVGVYVRSMAQVTLNTVVCWDLCWRCGSRAASSRPFWGMNRTPLPGSFSSGRESWIPWKKASLPLTGRTTLFSSMILPPRCSLWSGRMFWASRSTKSIPSPPWTGFSAPVSRSTM